MTQTIKFKKTVVAEPEVKPSFASNSSKFSYGIVPTHKWVEGNNVLRLLPQLEDSTYNNFIYFDEYSVFSKANPGAGCKFALTPAAARVLENVRWAIYNEENLRGSLFSAKNPHGLQLNASPKVGVYVLNMTDKLPCFSTVVLPGTRPEREGKEKPKVGAGTKLIRFCEEKDMKGNLKYGDLFDPNDGRVINVQVTNAGSKSVDYSLQVEYKLPLSDIEINEIKPFDQLFRFTDVKELHAYLQTYLPEDAYHAAKMAWAFGKDYDTETNQPF